MRIALSCRHILVRQEFFDYSKIDPTTDKGTRKMVPQPVQPEVIRKACCLPDLQPWSFEVYPLISAQTRKNELRGCLDMAQHIEGFVAYRNRLALAPLWITKSYHAPMEIHIFPSQLEHLATPKTRIHGKFDECSAIFARPFLQGIQ